MKVGENWKCFQNFDQMFKYIRIQIPAPFTDSSGI